MGTARAVPGVAAAVVGAIVLAALGLRLSDHGTSADIGVELVGLVPCLKAGDVELDGKVYRCLPEDAALVVVKQREHVDSPERPNLVVADGQGIRFEARVEYENPERTIETVHVYKGYQPGRRSPMLVAVIDRKPVGTIPLPPLPEARRVLDPNPKPDPRVRCRRTLWPDRGAQFEFILSREANPDGEGRVTVLRTTFAEGLAGTAMIPGGPPGVLASNVFNKRTVREMEVEVVQPRSQVQTERVSVPASLELPFGQPVLQVDSEVVRKTSFGGVLRVPKSVPTVTRPRRRILPRATVPLDFGWDPSVASARAGTKLTVRLVSPKPEELGLSTIFTGPQPARATATKLPPFKPGPVPLEYEVSWRRDVGTTRFRTVIPVEEPQGIGAG